MSIVPGSKSHRLSVFLDIEDLESIDDLEQYIDASAAILIFLSRGYFLSKNCLRELRSAIDSAKPLVLVHEVKPPLASPHLLSLRAPSHAFPHPPGRSSSCTPTPNPNPNPSLIRPTIFAPEVALRS